jgi:hypothetical protein
MRGGPAPKRRMARRRTAPGRLPQAQQAVPVTAGDLTVPAVVDYLGESVPLLWVSLTGLRGAAERPGACWHGMQTCGRLFPQVWFPLLSLARV